MNTERLTRSVLLAGAAFFVVTGAWAFFDPPSFYTEVATFPPYNRHLLHDVGAFQLGLAAALALGFVRLNATAAALWTAAVASCVHAVSHVLDRGLGGRSSDPVLLSAVAIAFLGAAVLATRGDQRRKDAKHDATASSAARIPTDRSARSPQHL